MKLSVFTDMKEEQRFNDNQ